MFYLTECGPTGQRQHFTKGVSLTLSDESIRKGEGLTLEDENDAVWDDGSSA